MPKYQFISGKAILAQVIRSLGYKLPSTYHDDILEWIGEGLGLMQVTNSLVLQSSGDEGCPGEINTSNYCASLPCGFVSVIAAEDCYGNRLPEGGDQTDMQSTSSNRGVNVASSQSVRVSSFEVNPFNHQTSTGLPTNSAGTRPPYYVDGQDIQKDNGRDGRVNNYYKIQGNYIQTSFECGFVKLHYYAIPVDAEGYPMIPDNSNFKLGLEWHIIRRLIGSGYKHDVFSYQYADQQCELYMGRGMGEVSFYTPEGAAKLNRSFVRLIPPYEFYENFFVNSEQPERLNK